MKKLALIFITLLTYSYSCEATIIDATDSLKLSKNFSHKTHIILPGSNLKIKTGSQVLKGTFKDITKDSLYLDLGETGTMVFASSDIKTIRGFGNFGAKAGGVILMGLGTSGMVFGTAGFIGGIAGLASGQGLAAIVGFLVTPLAPAGYGLFSLGYNVYGKNYKMHKWSIANE